MDLTIVILAAGKGTRMRSGLPKVLHPIGGKSMLSHVVNVAKSLSPSKIIIVHGDGKDLMSASLNNKHIVWAHQKHQKGTGDAVASAIDLIENNQQVLTLYGDVPLIKQDTLQRLIRVTSPDALGLLTAHVNDPTGLGRILRDEHDQVTAIREEKDANDRERQIHEVNTGIFLFPAEKLKAWLPKLNNQNAQNEYYLTDVISLAVEEGVAIQTAVPSVVNEISGVNNRAQLVTLERFYQKELANHYLEQGVFISDPNRFDLRGKLSCGLDVAIDVNVIFEGEVNLGDRVKIGPQCVLKNCHIESDVEIKGFCHLEDVIIRKSASIGPYARLRPGAEVGQAAHVGNFVEVKKSIIGKNSKVSHLSYIGDAEIGANVNVGAGTITCNYDGAKKHKTIIEDGAFIGSGTQLVAPVKVCKGATLAAGSTLTKDAPANKLTLTHQLSQRTIEWERPANVEPKQQTVDQ